MIIGISGKKGHGKDTVAEMIMSLTPDILWEVRKYADSLKNMVCCLLKCTREQLEDRDFKEKPLGRGWGDLTPRYILQILGTEGVRNIIHQDAWVLSLFMDYPNGYEIIQEIKKRNLDLVLTGHEPNSYKELQKEGWEKFKKEFLPHWLITDTRFLNEVNEIKRNGGIVIRVERNNMDDSDTHPSETSLDDYQDFDYTIYNDGNLKELRHKVEKLCQELKLLG